MSGTVSNDCQSFRLRTDDILDVVDTVSYLSQSFYRSGCSIIARQDDESSIAHTSCSEN